MHTVLEVLEAIAESTRRRILDAVRGRECSVSDLVFYRLRADPLMELDAYDSTILRVEPPVLLEHTAHYASVGLAAAPSAP